MSTDVAREVSDAALPGSVRVVNGCAVAEAAAIVRDSEVPVLFRGTNLHSHILMRDDELSGLRFIARIRMRFSLLHLL
eukprot:COSAG02_NODE_433_length_22435_cov_151.224078_7_plen_78_part_00